MTSSFLKQIVINYVDTDAGGVVYHANYLAFMESARSALLRQAGFPASVLRDKFNLVFVVTESNLKFKKPAYLDDELEVSVAVTSMRGASIVCHQQVTRCGEQQSQELQTNELLVDATIRIATITADTFLPCRIPSELRHVFAQFNIHSA